MRSPTRISFVRHGHVHNPQSIFYGRLPRYRLSEKGILQAEDASQFLLMRKFAAIFTSPLLRARQTARILLRERKQVPLYSSKLLHEVRTPYDGFPINELITRKWNVYSDVPPGYEQPTDVLERGLKFIRKVRESYPGRHVIAVTHGDLIAFLILWAKSVPVDAEQKQELWRVALSDNYPAPGSISTFIFRSTDSNELPWINYVNPSL